MNSRPNTTILNSVLKSTPGQDRTFPLFQCLPKELRLQIWEAATPRERMVHISLAIPQIRDGEEAPVRYLEKNQLGNPVSGRGYRVVSQDPRLEHELLRVNREARQVVLAFYRIHIPWHHAAAVPHGKTGAGPRTLHVNPEHDVLHISAEAPVQESLIDFLWDLKAYDPRGVGLLRLAVDLQGFCANDLQYLRRSDVLLIRQRRALVESLSQLQEVWFVYAEAGGDSCKRTASGRPGFLDGALNVVPFRFGAGMTAFERAGPDVRDGADQELQRLYMGSVDPRELIWRWNRLLRTWQICHEPGQVRYRLMVAQKPVPRAPRRSAKMVHLEAVMQFLDIRNQPQHSPHGDKGCLTSAVVADGSFPGSPGQCRHEEASRWSKTAAVGFWSFPLEAVGEVGDGERLCDMDFRPNRFLDMTRHWPELILAKIA